MFVAEGTVLIAYWDHSVLSRVKYNVSRELKGIFRESAPGISADGSS